MKTGKVMMIAVLCLFSIITLSALNSVKLKQHTVTATKYHPVKNQCSGNPLITADGSKINLGKLKTGKLRWIAVSRDLLSHYRYGDTIMVICANKNVSGKWVIHDTMSPRFKRKIDFLVHKTHTQKIPQKVVIHKV